MHEIWNKDITYLKRVGPQRAKALHSECRIATYGDLLHYFPRKYVDRSKVTSIRELKGEEIPVTLIGRITSTELIKGRNGRNRLSASFSDGTGKIELTWFQKIKWIQPTLKVGEEIALFGKLSVYQGQYQMTHPEIDFLKDESGTKNTLKIVPYYPSNEKLIRLGLDSRGFRGILHILLQQTHSYISETLNPAIMAEAQLISHAEAIRQIHFPENLEKLKAARKRLKFEEFFFYQLLLAQRRKTHKSENESSPFEVVGEHFNTFFAEHLPFQLTGAQKRVLKEIRRDLGQSVQMNRLVQGDVGSGKTMVAFMSMLIAKDNGFQCAMMAPTAILAEQHYKKLGNYASKIGLSVDLIVGGQKKGVRTQVLERLASGETDILVGTHALIEDPVQFQRLGLVVVDEQHKFGVMQRARLWKKASPYPHNMVMTATPIPRTLAMTLYGDIDVSVIDELPPGRKEIKTLVHRESKRLEVLGFIQKELDKGRQAYVVYPLVEESEKLDYLAAVKGYELLERYFTRHKVGIVHGKMRPEDKEFEMQRFVNNETQVLVSTTVIEVGVDVPNSTIILIENAEKFGLSQLHQLRGRVGRNAMQSYCILMAGYKVSDDGKKRLKAMTESNNGFYIAEMDLQLRGPGDFLGTRQSGIPQFQLANIAEDQAILQEARKIAFGIIDQDPGLALPEHAVIRKEFQVQKKHFSGVNV